MCLLKGWSFRGAVSAHAVKLTTPLAFLSDKFSWDDYTPAGKLELVQSNGETVQCALILMSEWEAQLPGYL